MFSHLPRRSCLASGPLQNPVQLTIRRDSLESGASANQWQCNGSATQHWRWQPVPTGTHWNLVNQNSGQCLQISESSQANGAIAVQAGCDSSPAQNWS
ncbi:RICIN domain-containing protein [Streptomyces sp. NPDC025273]|uniref:RICIN domain-containing protein n=1 Tax=unclassified Streptomyces TaxID=2593676 RepID=UPI0033E5A5B9